MITPKSSDRTKLTISLGFVLISVNKKTRVRKNGSGLGLGDRFYGLLLYGDFGRDGCRRRHGLRALVELG